MQTVNQTWFEDWLSSDHIAKFHCNVETNSSPKILVGHKIAMK